MKIGIVCYPTFGGSGVVATELGHGLCRAGHEVHFICYNQPARLTHRCRQCNKRFTHEKTTNCNGMIYCNGMTCCAPLIDRGGAMWQPLKVTRAEIVAPGEAIRRAA